MRDHRWHWLIGAAALVLVSGSQAGAAYAAEASGGIETVTVTAEKRTERLQDVPATITALSADQLEAGGITDTMHLAQSTPGLAFASTGGWTNYYMRGIGNAYQSPAAQSPVAMYVDGVYQADVESMAFGLDNIDHVEILKGPQGTLYGRNAVGGAINVITKAPSQDFDVKLKASAGNLGDQEYSGYITGGNDTVQANLAIDRHVRDGYYKQLIAGFPDQYNINDFAARGKLRFTPNKRVELTLGLGYSERKDRDAGLTLLPITPTTPLTPFNPFATPAPTGSVFCPPTCTVVNTAVLLGGTVPTKPWTTSSYDLPAYARNESVSLTGRFHFDDFDIVSITAAQDFINNHGVNESALNVPTVGFTSDDFHKQFSQELQILSPDTGRFTWIAGLYYLYNDAGISPWVINDFAKAPPPYVGPNAYVVLHSAVRGNSYAGFAQGTYNLTDALSVVGGVRYSVDEAKHYLAKETFYASVGGAMGPLLPPALLGLPSNPIVSSGASHTWYAFTPSVTLKYKRPEGLYYVTASKGYASGLFNIDVIAPFAALDTPVKPEKIKAIEAGAKWTLFDNHLQLNLAGFYYDLTDLQIENLAGIGKTNFQNANAKSQGIDADLTWAATSNLTIRAAFEILDAKYTSFPSAWVFEPNANQGNLALTGNGNAVCGDGPASQATPFDANCPVQLNLKGKRLMQSPKFSSNLGVDWAVPFLPEEDGWLLLTANWHHSSSYWMSETGTIVSPAYDLFNANLTYTLPNGQWSVSLWGNNLTDAKYYVTGAEDNYAKQISLAEPRTYGATISFHLRGD